ncbi:MAG: hypothetical protein LBE83_05815, partial [Propionibacteriaceae bacterium]|nr:hypothetical protein [Propionibacteriaceae bacterium]
VRYSAAPTFVQHCLTVASDHYYLLFFLIPLFLLLIFFVVEDDDAVVIMRYRSYFGYFVRKWGSLVIVGGLFLVVQALAVVIAGIALPLESDWSIADGTVTKELFDALSGLFSSPGLALASLSAYLMIGLAVIIWLMMGLAHFISRSWMLRLVITWYLLSVLALKLAWLGQLPITTFAHLVILHHNLSGYRLAVTVLTTAVLVSLIAYLVKKQWNRSFSRRGWRPRGITAYYCQILLTAKNLVILGLVVTALVFWNYRQAGGNLSGLDWVAGLFAGHGTGQFYVLGFLEMLILSGAPVYLIAVFVERMTNEHSVFVTVRLNKRSQMVGGILTAAGLLLAIYALLLFFIPLLAMGLTDRPLDAPTLGLLGLSVAMRLLDLVGQVLFVTAIYCLTGKVIVAFFAWIAACAVSLLPVPGLPIGLSSLLRLDLTPIGTEGLPPWLAGSILLVFAGGLSPWVWHLGRKYLPRY